MKRKSIRIIITGGTIDDIDIGSKKKKSYIPRMLKEAKVDYPVSMKKLMLKDSGEITNRDRELILKECKECKEDKILITHGTFTLAETARLLGRKTKNKTIVLFGSMIPFNKKNSDALFNLGCAITAVQTLKKGTYITMNGKIFLSHNVRKNIRLGKFEELK